MVHHLIVESTYSKKVILLEDMEIYHLSILVECCILREAIKERMYLVQTQRS